MLIDELREKGFEIKGIANIRQAIVFRIEEEATEFSRTGHDLLFEQGGRVILPQRLPFDNVFLNFFDCGLWVFYNPEQPQSMGQIFFKGNMIFGNAMVISQFNNELSLISHKAVSFDTSNTVQFSEAQDPQKLLLEMSISIVLKFLHFLSCNNIRTRDAYPPQQLQKKRIKNGKLPLVTYKILELRPVSSSTGIAHGLWTNRIHLCRGHTAEYGINGKGLLFGKYSGRFWIPPCCRGDKSKGIIIKDYKIPA